MKATKIFDVKKYFIELHKPACVFNSILEKVVITSPVVRIEKNLFGTVVEFETHNSIYKLGANYAL